MGLRPSRSLPPQGRTSRLLYCAAPGQARGENAQVIVVRASPRCTLLALLAALFPSLASPAEPASPPPPPYVDRLIGGASEESSEESIAPRPSDSLPGLRTWSVEARGETRDISAAGRSSSGGVMARYA